ncbi:hypothetical protein LCGC14_2552700, partial [marine sediment metagenome]
GLGWDVVQTAIDREYKNLFHRSADLRYIDPHSIIHRKFDMKPEEKTVAGFTTSTKTRPLLISKLDTYFRDRSIIVHSQRLIDELYVFIYNSVGKPEAQRSYNDDLVISLCLALWVRDTALRLRQQGIEINKKALDSFETNISQEGIYSNLGRPQHDPYIIRTGAGEEDIRWLLPKK